MVTTRNKQSANNDPRSKLLKKVSNRAIQKQAFNELLLKRANNSGQLKFGVIQKIVNEYNKLGYTSVNRRNLHYR
jgi:hypothetical protein